VNQTLDPSAAAFLTLINKARPGMGRIEALANGAHYKAALAMRTGMTPDEYAGWCDRHHGLSLVVHLDPAGHPAAVKLMPHHEADKHAAGRPNAITVAMWGV
jgi:hypothetical protein